MRAEGTSTRARRHGFFVRPGNLLVRAVGKRCQPVQYVPKTCLGNDNNVRGALSVRAGNERGTHSPWVNGDAHCSIQTGRKCASFRLEPVPGIYCLLTK